MSDYKYTPTKLDVGKSRITIWASLVGIIVLLVWASFAKIDQVTRATAKVIASARTQQIQAPEGGVLTKILVQEGGVVKKGDLLVVLEEERAKASVANSQSKIAALTAKMTRLDAEIYNKPLVFSEDLRAYPEYANNQAQLYNRRRQAINQEIQAFKKQLTLAVNELNMNKPLLQYGDVSRADVIKLERQVADIEAKITNRQNKYFEDAQAEMTKAREELDVELEQLRDKTQVLEEKRLFAPTDGKINNIKVTTIGGVVRPSDVIMEILPTSSDLVVEAKVSPVDIANVKEGQMASVKLDAYDFSIFGSMKGEVFHISPDALVEQGRNGEELHYRVLIKIIGADFEEKADEIVIKPGMTASVDIKARERTVLSYITKPIIKTLSEGLGEK